MDVPWLPAPCLQPSRRPDTAACGVFRHPRERGGAPYITRTDGSRCRRLQRVSSRWPCRWGACRSPCPKGGGRGCRSFPKAAPGFSRHCRDIRGARCRESRRRRGRCCYRARGSQPKAGDFSIFFLALRNTVASWVCCNVDNTFVHIYRSYLVTDCYAPITW